MAVGSATMTMAQNVAKIGSTEYATLKEAVDAVQEGKRVTSTFLMMRRLTTLALRANK